MAHTAKRISARLSYIDDCISCTLRCSFSLILMSCHLDCSHESFTCRLEGRIVIKTFERYSILIQHPHERHHIHDITADSRHVIGNDEIHLPGLYIAYERPHGGSLKTLCRPPVIYIPFYFRLI